MALMMTMPSSDQMRSTSRRESSRAISSCSACTTPSALSVGMTKQIDCSDEACEIISTLVAARATAVNVRPAIPGTPTIPRPAIVIMLRSVIIVTAFTVPCVFVASRTMRVPGRSGWKVFFTHSGISRSITGRMVRGWRTFAPK